MSSAPLCLLCFAQRLVHLALEGGEAKVSWGTALRGDGRTYTFSDDPLVTFLGLLNCSQQGHAWAVCLCLSNVVDASP